MDKERNEGIVEEVFLCLFVFLILSSFRVAGVTGGGGGPRDF